MARETWVQSQVESYQWLKKWYLMPPCLTLTIIRYGLRVKWSNPGKGVAPSPTPWCSSYRKGRLRLTLDYGRQLYFTFYKVQNVWNNLEFVRRKSRKINSYIRDKICPLADLFSSSLMVGLVVRTGQFGRFKIYVQGVVNYERLAGFTIQVIHVWRCNDRFV